MKRSLVKDVALFMAATLVLFGTLLLTVHSAPAEDEPIAINVTDVEIIAQILYHECRGLPALEQSAVVWTILNRVDSELAYFPDTVYEVCTQKMGGAYMFAYRADAPIEEELYNLAFDVLERWEREKRGDDNVGRTLPCEYVYFWGDGQHNYFRVEYQGKQYWDWSLPNPYMGEDEP